MALASAKNNPSRSTIPVVQALAAPVKSGVTCFQGGLAVLDAGEAAPGRTALGLVAVGWFEKTFTAGQVAEIVPGVRLIGNSAGADEVTAADVGKDAFIVDDETVAKTDGGGTRSRAGKVAGVDASGRVYLLAAMSLGADATPKIQRLTGTLAAGVLAISSGFSLTATSAVICQRITGAGTQGDELRVPAADRTVGAPGVAAITVRSFLNGAAATSDTSTFEVLIVG